MKSLCVVLSTIVILASCGRQESTAQMSAAPNQSKVVINGFSTDPLNGGINPAFFATKITVNFTGGGNACIAAQYDFAIRQVHVGTETHIVVTQTPHKTAFRVVCPMDYAPVSMSLSTIVSGKANDVVVIDNVKRLGANVRLSL